jgi:hypothetical protein
VVGRCFERIFGVGDRQVVWADFWGRWSAGVLSPFGGVNNPEHGTFARKLSPVCVDSAC